ncbi:MAG: Cl-channel, voltage-gated family protein [Bryobacterales bacterium]|nr:Cl-channel, voltage-gated family protein [Bryobacterales bacterium]
MKLPAKKWSKHLERHEERVFLVLTLVIGALVGLVVVAFILLTGTLGARMYPPHGAPWRRLVVPVLGSLASGYLLYRYFPFARGSGIPQTKAALFAREGRIRLRTVFGKFFCCSVSLASGIALGREGPAVQVGAGIASVLGRRLGLPPERVKALLPIGASAAVAAAFNTPIAGVLFSLEEIMGDLHAPVLGSVVLSSATAWMVLHLLLGDEPLFHVPPYQLVHGLEFAVYAVLGVVGGLVSVLFVKLLLKLRAWFLRLPAWTRWFQPVAGGLAVGIMGWFVPQSLGIGYQYVGEALNGNMLFQAMALLMVLRIIGTTLCYASGNAGGIFGPSLFIGAMMGGAVGSVAHTLLPQYTAAAGPYALVGMGSAFAGIIRVPMTSVIMIFEVTRDYSIIVPLMISNLISFFISSRLQPEPIYEALSRQEGIHLPAGETRARHGAIRVVHAMRSSFNPVRPDTTVSSALEEIRALGVHAWPVADRKELLGMITTAQLESAASDGSHHKTIVEILPPLPQPALNAGNFPHVHGDHSLDLALQRMGDAGLDVLPVVGRDNVRELLGVISLPDALRAYGIRNAPNCP